MKLRILAGLVLAAALVLFGGCLQMHSTTVVKDDGSGTATLKLSFSPSVAEAMQELSELDPNSSQGMPDFKDLDKAKIQKAAKGHGVKITSFSTGDENDRTVIDLAMEFKDLKGLSYVLGHVLGEGDNNGGIGIFDAGDGNFVLRSTEYDFPAEEVEEAETEVETEVPGAGDMDPAKMQKMMELTGKLMGAMAEMDVRMEFTVPGDIVSSNAPQTEGRTCIYTINASNMMANQNMEPEIVFSGKGLKIKPLAD